jgi:hypothetical protein
MRPSTSPTLLISANFSPRNDFPSSSKEFVARVEHLLKNAYSCDADLGLRVCTRRVEYDNSRGGAGRTVRKCARMAGSLVLVILSEVGRLFLPSSTLVSHRE